MQNPPVGSAAWTGGREYEDEYAERIHRFIEQINEQAVLDYVSALRKDQEQCTISPEFSVGNFNLVRKVKFDDGVEWIVRFRMPPMPGQDNTPISLQDMQSELDTMEFVRLNTDIKLPKVFGYNLDEQNPVGCPFSIMEYIHGNTAEEVSQSYSGDHEGIPPKFREKFWGQMATIMVQLASIRVPKIGSIFRSNTDTDLYIVGPMVETGSGPYGSAAEFYRDFPSALGSSLEREGEPVPGQDELLRAFQYIALSLPEPKGNGFGLANYDLNPNNILVDQEFNVLGVIDWDSVVALPDIALYRLPFLMGISCAVPGIVPSHPLEIKRHELGHRFAQIVEAVSQEQTTNRSDTKSRSTSLFTRAGFFSKGALAFRSLVFVKMKQDFVNSEWLQGLQWLGEHDEEEVAKFYFGG